MEMKMVGMQKECFCSDTYLKVSVIKSFYYSDQSRKCHHLCNLWIINKIQITGAHI